MNHDTTPSQSMVDDLMAQLQGAPMQQMAQQLGASSTQMQSAVGAALPLLLGALGNNAAHPQGAAALLGALPELSALCTVETLDLMQLDSTDVTAFPP